MAANTALLGVPAWSTAALLVLVSTAAATDVRWRKIPSWLTYPAILIGLAGHALAGGLYGSGDQPGLSGAAAGLAVGSGPLLLCWLAGGIGGGDVKLMGAIGALGGWRLCIGAMLYGFIVAALMAIVVMVHKRVVWRTLRRVLHTMALLVMPGARPADPTGPDSPKIPFAAALCAGTVAAIISSALKSGLGQMLFE